ncbi:MAG: hypothetical protein HOG49_30930 [Candidatus Scalindua sp.]|jgi:hypothetical protein|nr:hypothetical protein [Candidatus Scalindua sp.]
MPKFQVKEGKKHYWKKAVVRGGKDSVLNDRLLKGGDLLVCEECELGSARDKFILIQEQEVKQEPVYGFVIRKVADKQYDVISEKTGDKLNDECLSHEEAKKLIKAQRANG